MGITAVFGGTFNPFHIGHYAMLSALCEQKFIDSVFVTPDKIPPHKKCELLASDEDRVEMCKIVCADFDKAQVCTVDTDRDGKSYTVDTMKLLRGMYPEREFAFVCGGDMIALLDSWYDWETLIGENSFIAFNRSDLPDFDRQVERMRSLGADITVIKADIPDVSSSAFRKTLDGKLLPLEIYKYIKRKGLYMPDYSEYKEILKARLNEKRYVHSLAVADEARRLAVKYGADAEKAYLAGLLHDITKNAPREEHLKLFETFGIMLSDIEQNAEKLWHAMSGAVYIKYFLNIEDTEIIDAIRYHTTAKADIPLLSLILYLADFTSADRDYEDVDVIRKLVDESLFSAYKYALSYSITDLVMQGRAIHPDTVNAYNQVALKGSIDFGS